jgi:hypothetical protein
MKPLAKRLNAIFGTQMTAAPAPRAKPQDDGEQYRKMVCATIEKLRGSHVGAALTVHYNSAKGGHEFAMWCGHVGLKGTHTLLASETSQERLDSHWKGFVENVAAARNPNPWVVVSDPGSDEENIVEDFATHAAALRCKRDNPGSDVMRRLDDGTLTTEF